MPTALITGASRGFGKALAEALGRRGWQLIVDGRDGAALRGAAQLFGAPGDVIAIAGDVADSRHRADLRDAVRQAGRLDLLVNNASILGPVPLPGLGDFPLEELERVLEINAVAPLGLIQMLLPELRASAGTIVNLSSDAALEPYPGWGVYGSSKAALDQLTAVLATEEPEVRIYSFDPGDMRTDMAQQAFPGEDISDRVEPETVVPALLRLVDERPPSGRYGVGGLLAVQGDSRS